MATIGASGAPPPPPPPPGGSERKKPRSKPDHEGHGEVRHSKDGSTWTKDCKTKTCKCFFCGEMVKRWSLKCSLCRRALCSECYEQSPSRYERDIKSVEDSVRKGCWCRRHPDNFHPKISKIPKEVQTRDQERKRDNDAKVKGEATKLKNKSLLAGGDTDQGEASTTGKKRKQKQGYLDAATVSDEGEKMSPVRKTKRKVTQAQEGIESQVAAAKPLTMAQGGSQQTRGTQTGYIGTAPGHVGTQTDGEDSTAEKSEHTRKQG